jgi:hypothetical protein
MVLLERWFSFLRLKMGLLDNAIPPGFFVPGEIPANQSSWMSLNPADIEIRCSKTVKPVRCRIRSGGKMSDMLCQRW